MQPYCHGIARGVKHVETRDWSPPTRLIGRLVALHSSKQAHPISMYASACALFETLFPEFDWRDLPTGCVVAVAKLTCAFEATPEIPWYIPEGGGSLLTGTIHGGGRVIRATELETGDLGPGRWGWVFEDARLVDPPVEIRGQQGVWRWRTAEGTNHTPPTTPQARLL